LSIFQGNLTKNAIYGSQKYNTYYDLKKDSLSRVSPINDKKEVWLVAVG
jgi:hypothetical protein